MRSQHVAAVGRRTAPNARAPGAIARKSGRRVGLCAAPGRRLPFRLCSSGPADVPSGKPYLRPDDAGDDPGQTEEGHNTGGKM